ncbi:MAG: hypothetical protein JWP94_2903 [Mucilaginibacter sp.]|nr:hypothetical protein [Mucilaginibacter sp.]
MKNVKYIAIFVISVMGCKKPYAPPAITVANHYLVVEGVINPGPDSTIIKLSRTVNISSKITTNPERGAALTVESDQNVGYPLTETGNGKYASPGLNLDITRKYRLSIKTADNQQYLSDFEPAYITPRIDSIGYNITSVPDTGLQIYASAHNSNSSTRYYRWDYSETWRFHAKYLSLFVSNGSGIVQRQPSQYFFYCFASDSSSDIVLGSSAKLHDNVIYQNPTVHIPSTSEKIELEYSILLRQYAITATAYAFWRDLKKDTEQLGSIFDAQPSQIKGNIHNINDPAEPVLGYVSICSVQSKRIFINRNDLPDTWQAAYPYGCEIDSPGTQGPAFLYPQPNNFVPLSAGGTTYTTAPCADCRIRGTQTVPPFWK